MRQRNDLVARDRDDDGARIAKSVDPRRRRQQLELIGARHVADARRGEGRPDPRRCERGPAECALDLFLRGRIVEMRHERRAERPGMEVLSSAPTVTAVSPKRRRM